MQLAGASCSFNHCLHNMTYCAPTGGVSNAAAREATLRKQVPAAPAGRYGMSVVVHMDKLWLFGGTDGGYHQSEDDGYQHGEVPGSLMCSTETAGSLLTVMASKMSVHLLCGHTACEVMMNPSNMLCSLPSQALNTVTSGLLT